MFEFLIKVDTYILTTLFLPIARLWHRLTGYTPSRLAWICFGVAVIAAVLGLYNDLANPALSYADKIWRFFVTCATLYFFSVLLNIAALTSDGVRPRDRFFFTIVSLMRLGLGPVVVVMIMALVFHRYEGDLLFYLFPQITGMWAGLYFVNIYLPPQPLTEGSRIGVKNR